MVHHEFGALRAQRTQMHADDQGVAVGHNDRSQHEPQWGCERLEPDAVVVMRALG